MKFKILQNQKGLYSVQFKYKYWPFWFWDKGYTMSGDATILVWDDKEKALNRIKSLVDENEKDNWVDVTGDIK